MGHTRYLYQLPEALLFAAAVTAASGAALGQAEAPLPRDSAAPYSLPMWRVQGEPDAKAHVVASKLKDALRTVTGLIGCVNARDRAVRTPTATAGIRW